MKGSYDFGPEFVLYFSRRKDLTDTIVDYASFDGMPVKTTIEHLNSKVANPYLSYSLRGRVPYGREVVTEKSVIEEEIVSRSLTEDEITDVAFEYDIAELIRENYKNMSVLQRKFALAFLERYLLSFEEVRDFGRNGILDLKEHGKVFNIFSSVKNKL